MHEPILDKRFRQELRCRIPVVSPPRSLTCPRYNFLNPPAVLRDHSVDYVVVLVGQDPETNRGLRGGVQVLVEHTAAGVMVDISVRLRECLNTRTGGLSTGSIVGHVAVALPPSPDPSKPTRKCLNCRHQRDCSVRVVLPDVMCRFSNGTLDADKIPDGSGQFELQEIELLVQFRWVSTAINTVDVRPDVHVALSSWDLCISEIIDSPHSEAKLSFQVAMTVGMQSSDILPALFDQIVQFADLVFVDEVSRILDLDLAVVRIPDTPALEKIGFRHDSSKGVIPNVLVPG
jgi:hypothetical protein